MLPNFATVFYIYIFFYLQTVHKRWSVNEEWSEIKNEGKKKNFKCFLYLFYHSIETQEWGEERKSEKLIHLKIGWWREAGLRDRIFEVVCVWNEFDARHNQRPDISRQNNTHTPTSQQNKSFTRTNFSLSFLSSSPLDSLHHQTFRGGYQKLTLYCTPRKFIPLNSSSFFFFRSPHLVSIPLIFFIFLLLSLIPSLRVY